MNECMEREIQEMLPDVLHGAVSPGERRRIDAHLASCGVCREELEVLRAVQGAAVFSPAIDVAGIVRQIPPYRIITPEVERAVPSRAVPSRMVKWLVAAGFALVVVGGGSVVMQRGDVVDAPLAVSVERAHGLALAAGVDGLSDGGIVQLMNEMSGFDALPGSEPEPVLAEDTSSPSNQDSL